MKTKPDQYKVILWDFDGVIVESNKVRESGFRKVLEQFPEEQIEELIKFHNLNGGLSRYVKFRYFYEVICKSSISEEKVQHLADSFSEIMLKKLGSKEYLINDTVKFIESNSNSIEMNIVSGSDQNELRILCSRLDIDKNFKSICGSPTPKNTLVADYLKNSKFKNEEICLIGDSMNDYEAAAVNEIDFYGYNNVELEYLGRYIKSFYN
ncbi:HAD family hydrolase [Flavobacterium sp. 123]|uniref:HAD family hydrolase n=1 Tax=Flavobacterium sp. 123 TaxID=2135627 RepID=UPI000EAFDB2C|nr:HAD hydrolase-like protein [Flavobacterium sp. 123]RKS99985.1 phosphoglycolate phosphatase-like HAD superfamily hydrolase [Flavobacterium sp. 123]